MQGFIGFATQTWINTHKIEGNWVKSKVSFYPFSSVFICGKNINPNIDRYLRAILLQTAR